MKKDKMHYMQEVSTVLGIFQIESNQIGTKKPI